MKDTETLIYDLGKDVAVMSETQRAFQLYQTKTTENVDKLAVAVQLLIKETTKLETIFNTIHNLDKKMEKFEERCDKRVGKIETAYANWSKAVGVALAVGAIGTIFKYATGV